MFWWKLGSLLLQVEVYAPVNEYSFQEYACKLIKEEKISAILECC